MLLHTTAYEHTCESWYSMLSSVLRMQDSELELTDAFLRDVVINFLLAGRDTTASTLTWLFYNLARTPHAEQKVYY